MRTRIFIFEQQVALRLGLNLNELLLLDYLHTFINSGNMRCKQFGNDIYYKITYKKIQEDLPILDIKERQIRNIFSKLEEKEIIKKATDAKNQLYINVDFDILYGNKLPSKFSSSAINYRHAGNGLLTIDYYDIKKIKINCESAHAIKINYQEFVEIFKNNIALFTSETFYTAFIKDKLTLDEIGNDYFIFSVSNVKAITSINGEKFKSAFERTISDILNMQTS